MRRLQMLASLALAASLMATSSAALAQSTEVSTTVSTPRALEPDGRLPLQGTPWRLRSYRFRGIDRAPGPEVAAWMRLGDADVQAAGGCTRIRSRYGATGGAIRFGLRRLKENDCAEQTTMVQLAMVDGLRKARSFEIIPGREPSEDQLVLRSAWDVELLRFGLDDIATLDIGEWRLESYTVDGVATQADADQPALLAFRPSRDHEIRRISSGPLSGSTGCNGIVADFFRNANVVSFGELDRTDAPCTPSLAAQEEAVIAVLDATSSMISLPADQLTLTSSDTGERLEFISSRPLEGSTWLLSGVPGERLPDDVVTLRLSDGSASGEGPCGPFGASYATDGVFITFTDVAGSGDGSCADLVGQRVLLSERELFSALRSTVRLDRDRPRLRMLDARGHLTASFDQPGGP